MMRWWIAGLIAALAAVRVAVAGVFALIGSEPADRGGGLVALLAALDAVCLALAVVAIVAFVQYGRIYNARIPTE